MLHPVSWPNHGPNIELYLAEEAVGLVKSMDWNLMKGPMWEFNDDQSDDEDSDVEESLREELEGPSFDVRDNIARMKKEGIKDGDYVYGPEVQGVFFKSGVILDFEEDESLKDDDEWINSNLRESVAKSCLIRCR